MNTVSQRAKMFIWRTSGVVSVSMSDIMPLMRPISVRSPVATTTPRPAPAATSVPLNSIERRSPQSGIGGNRSGRLVDGHGFAGQNRLFDLEAARLDEPQIGGDTVARLDQHQIARHQVDGVNALSSPVTEHGGPWCEHPPDRLHRLFGAAFLNEADHRIDDHHRQDDAGINEMTQHRSHTGRANQHIDEQVVEVRKKPQNGALARRVRAGGSAHTPGACGRLLQYSEPAGVRLQSLQGMPGW